MSSGKGNDDQGEWEEVLTMMELPSGANLNTSKKDLYLQVAGMWTDKAVVKLDNMLYVGNISETLGSNLFVECKKGDDVEITHRKMETGRDILTTQTNMTLDPIYLKDKTGEPSDQSQTSSTETEGSKKT